MVKEATITRVIIIYEITIITSEFIFALIF